MTRLLRMKPRIPMREWKSQPLCSGCCVRGLSMSVEVFFATHSTSLTLSRTSWCLGNSHGWSTGSSYSVIIVIVSCEANLYLRLLLALLTEVRTFSMRTIGAIKWNSSYYRVKKINLLVHVNMRKWFILHTRWYEH